MPLYLGPNEASSRTDPTGRISGSAAATPLWTATPDAVTRPLQYAVALNARRDPGSGGAEGSCSVAPRPAHFEARAVTSVSDPKTPPANGLPICPPPKRV